MKEKVEFCNLYQAMDSLKKEFPAFCKKLNIIPKGGGTRIPFILNETQKQLLNDLHARSAIVKARQIGGTTFAEAIALYISTKVSNGLWGSVSYKEDSAKKIIRDLKGLVDNADPSLGISVDKTLSNVTAFRLLPSETMIEAETGSSDNPFRGQTPLGILASEGAYWKGSDTAFEAFEKSVPIGGMIILESTAHGTNNVFYHRVQSAKKNIKPEVNQYKLLFYPWYLHKSYNIKAPKSFKPTPEELELRMRYGVNDDQLYWRRTELPGYPNHSRRDQMIFDSSYPADINTCWGAAIESPFDTEKLLRMVVTQPLYYGCFNERVYAEYNPKLKYYIGIDPARTGYGDDSAIVILDQSMNIVCVYNQGIHYGRFQVVIKELMARYNARGFLECNNFGQIIYDRLKDDRVFGLRQWLTSETSKIHLMGLLDRFIQKKDCIHDDPLRTQLNEYDITSNDNKDDLLMAAGIALECLLSNSFYRSDILMGGGLLEQDAEWQERDKEERAIREQEDREREEALSY